MMAKFTECFDRVEGMRGYCAEEVDEFLGQLEGYADNLERTAKLIRIRIEEKRK